MSKKNIILIGDPGGGKTVSLETLPGGVVDWNLDQGGWRSLEREPSIKTGGRHPKKLRFAKTFQEWVGGKEILQKDEILIIDYSMYATPIEVGKLTSYDTKVFFDLIKDLNLLEKLPRERGVCHFCIDSLTSLQWYILHGIVNLAGHKLTGTSQYSYGLAIEKMREIIDVCCHQPQDFILTAHTESEKDEILGKIQETILLYGKKLPGILLSMIDDIYYCTVGVISGKKDYLWGTAPEMFLKIIRQRSFDDLPIKLPQNFSTLYKGKLYCE